MSETSVPTPRPTTSFMERVMGAMRLDAATYDEVEHDETALGQAAGVVVIGAIAAAIGAAGSGSGGSIIGAPLGALLGWLVSAVFVWFIGVQWMDHTSDYKELLRTLGFASAPNIALVLGIVPVIGAIVALVVVFWGLAAYVIAVREALDVETGRAIVVCLLAYALKIIVVALLIGIFGGLAALGGAAT